MQTAFHQTNSATMKLLPILLATGLLAAFSMNGNAKEAAANTTAVAAYKPSDIKGFPGKWTGVVYMKTAAGEFEQYNDFKLNVKKNGDESATITGTAKWQKTPMDTTFHTVKVTGTLKRPKMEKIDAVGHEGFIKRATASLRFSNGTTGSGYFQVSEVNGYKGSGTSVSFKRGPWSAKPPMDARFYKVP
jgi:hypothetical protein